MWFTPLLLGGASILSGTISRPNSDIVVSGWTSSDAQPLYTDIDEVIPSDVEYIYSPPLSGSIVAATFGLSLSLVAGNYDVNTRGRMTGSASNMRVVLLDSGGVAVGTSAWQALTNTFATYTLNVTTTGTATQVRIDAQ